MRNLFFLSILFLAFSCSETTEPDVVVDDEVLDHKLDIQVSTHQLQKFNDLFFLDSVYIAGTDLWIEVSYSGGCQEHDFMVVWPEVITMVYPPDFGVTLYHNSNGDACEAFIHDTLRVDLTHTPVGEFDPATIEQMHLTVVNGSRPEETKSTH